MSKHATLIRRATKDRTLPRLAWSEALSQALRPAAAAVLEWRSPAGHVVIIEPDLPHLVDSLRAFVARAGITGRAARPPSAMLIEHSRVTQVEPVDLAAPESTPLRAPAGEPIGDGAWLIIEAGALPLPEGSFFATLLERRTARPALLSREALIAAAIGDLDDDEAEEHADDDDLLRELLLDRFAAQETAAEEHLRSGALRRGTTDVATGTHAS